MKRVLTKDTRGQADMLAREQALMAEVDTLRGKLRESALTVEVEALRQEVAALRRDKPA